MTYVQTTKLGDFNDDFFKSIANRLLHWSRVPQPPRRKKFITIGTAPDRGVYFWLWVSRSAAW